MSRNILPSALVLGLSIIIAGWIFGNKFYQSRFSNRYVSVKGLAEMEVKARKPMRSICWVEERCRTREEISDR